MAAATLHPRPRVAVSACLLGQMVRYDGQHKRDDFVAGQLARFVDFEPICPEVEAGMGTPREPVHLEQIAGELKMLGNESRTDHTNCMQQYASNKVESLKHAVRGNTGAGPRLAGFILKARSPSCGMSRVKVVHANKPPTRDGVGLFASRLQEQIPELPVEEEGRLNDHHLRTAFCEAVFAFDRLSRLFQDDWKPGQVVAFHACEKFLLLSHDETHYRELGRLTSTVGDTPCEEFATQYIALFMRAMNKPAEHGPHCNVLDHMAGFLRENLTAVERAGLRAVIDEYRAKQVPLVAPADTNTSLRYGV